MRASKCPRCGADMFTGVCDNCGFPIVGSRKKRTKVDRFHRGWSVSFR